MGRLFRFVVSGKSVAELRDNMEVALAELSGEETTPVKQPQPAARPSSLPIDEEQIRQVVIVNPPAPQSVAQPTGVDSMGLPWDERIHSSNMAKTKDGSWRTRRGVEPTYVRQVEHELIDRIKNGGAAEAPTFHAPVAPQVPGPIPHVAPAVPQVPTAPSPAAPSIVPPLQFSPPVTPAAPPPPVQGPITSAHSLETFKTQFVPLLAQLVNEGKLTREYVAALKNYFQLEQIYLANDTQKAEMFETFCKAGLLTKVG